MFKEVLRRNLAILVLLGMLFSCINIGVYANEDQTQQVQSVENNKVEFDEMLRRNGFDPIMYRNIDIMKGIQGLEPAMFPSFEEYLFEFERRLIEEGPILLYKLRRESMRRDMAMGSPLNAESVINNEPVQEPVKGNANRYIIKYKNSESSSKVQNQLRNKIEFSKSFDKQSLRVDKSTNKATAKVEKLEVVKFNEDITIEELTQDLENANIYSEIEYIQPDYEIRLSSVIDDQWGLLNTTQVSNEVSIDVNVSPAWSISEGDGIIVAVIDSGIDITHEGLSDNIWINENESGNGTDDDGNGFVDDINGWNFINNTNEVHNSSGTSDELHGTHVAGIIAANGGATLGVAPKAKILPLKVFENGIAYTSNVIEAIQYAESMGAKVANCSWGMSQNNQALKDTMAASNMLFVCAAGNNGTNNDNNPVYPASYNLPNVISAASIANNGTKSSFSNYGVNTVHVSAPGQGIRSTIPNNSYGQQSGTSMSAAFVSGQAALVLSKFLDLNATQAKNQIIFSSHRLSTLQDYIMDGNKVNCEKSLSGLVSAENIRNIYQIEDNTPVSNDDDILSSFSTGDIKQISAGVSHNLLLMNDGSVYAWGNNTSGQLGHKNSTYNISPIIVIFPDLLEGEKIESIMTGYYHNVAISNQGNMFTWGDNCEDQLGRDLVYGEEQVPKKVQITGEKFKSAAVGEYHTLALSESGKIYRWGLTMSGINPILIPGETIKSIATGYYHYMALSETGNLYMWGSNMYGQLGNGGTNIVTTPTIIAIGETVDEIAAGEVHSMAISKSGNLYTWGFNEYGQLGNGSTNNVYTPTQITISGGEKIKSIAANQYNSVAISESDDLYSWGFNEYGQLGDGTNVDKDSPTLVTIGSGGNIKAITAGGSHNLALTTDYKLYAWGDNYFCQLGAGFIHEYSSFPINVKFPKRLSLNLQVNTILDFALTASSVTNPGKYIYDLIYDTSKYIVDDLCKYTTAKELDVGFISGTNILIMEHDPTIGLITIVLNDESENFTGILNTIVFKVISDGEGIISVINYYL